MKVTKKLREQAAVLCSAAASYEEYVRLFSGTSAWKPRHMYGLLWFAHMLDLPDSAATLGEDVTRSITGATRIGFTTRETWAEAEALLRCGFAPEGWES